MIIHTLLWSINNFELQEQISQFAPRPPAAIPFLSALDQQNIYDLKATQSIILNKHLSYITYDRIDELYQLVRAARNDQIDSFNTTKSSSNNSKWNFEKFVAQKSPTSNNDTNTQIETFDSTAAKGTNIKLQFNLTTTENTINENDKIQLRYFIHHTLTKWKLGHQNDKTISLADIMHDGLAEDEPA